MFHKIHTQYSQKGGYLLLGWNPIREVRALIEGSSFAFRYQVFTGCQKSVFLWRSPNLNYIKRLVTIINHNISPFTQSPSQLAEDSALHNFQ